MKLIVVRFPVNDGKYQSWKFMNRANPGKRYGWFLQGLGKTDFDVNNFSTKEQVKKWINHQ